MSYEEIAELVRRGASLDQLRTHWRPAITLMVKGRTAGEGTAQQTAVVSRVSRRPDQHGPGNAAERFVHST